MRLRLPLLALAMAVASGALASGATGEPGEAPAPAALLRAEALFHPAGSAARVLPAAARPDPREATLILRDLRVALPALAPDQRRRAESLLARPTDSPDPFGDSWPGAEAPNSPACDADLCVHWTNAGLDAPNPADVNDDGVPDWVAQTQTVLEHVWDVEIGGLGYRPPKSDASSANDGGNGLLDVYLSNLGSVGVFGYCASDDPTAATAAGQRDASAFCVLDDDFAQSQFGGPPLSSLRVTSAHEFFHSVQFGYDAFEDPWLMEGTAMWMEDVVYDGINQSVDYLGVSALKQPSVPLDSPSDAHFFWYGSWIWFRFLTERLGGATPDNAVIRHIWERADGDTGGPNDYSMEAIRNEVTAQGLPSLSSAYGDFAAWNRNKQRYDEGRSYPAPVKVQRFTLGPAHRGTGLLSVRMNHMSNLPAVVQPGSRAPMNGHVTIRFDLPDRSRGPAARVLVRFRSGLVATHQVPLGPAGGGTIRVKFGRGAVSGVTVLAVNGSSRYTCSRGTALSCHGTPLDNGRRYAFSAHLS